MNNLRHTDVVLQYFWDLSLAQNQSEARIFLTNVHKTTLREKREWFEDAIANFMLSY